MRYGQIKDGESFTIDLPYRLLLQCCSCGLVHIIKFRMQGNKLEINIKNHKGETKKVREQDRVKRATRKLKV